MVFVCILLELDELIMSGIPLQVTAIAPSLYTHETDISRFVDLVRIAIIDIAITPKVSIPVLERLTSKIEIGCSLFRTETFGSSGALYPSRPYPGPITMF